jgi:Uma2 family endonuclease
MAAFTLTLPRTLADVVRDLGGIPLHRIHFPAGNATEDDVVRFLDGADKRIYELIDGVLVEKMMGLTESIPASFIGRILGNYVDEHDLGVVFAPDGPVRIRPGRIRFPDTGFIPWSRIPGEVVPGNPITDIVPALSVEVISEGNTDAEMESKLRDYFAAGVKLVWYIYPATETAISFTSPSRPKELRRGDSLEGGRVVPGFSLPLQTVFEHLTRRKKKT